MKSIRIYISIIIIIISNKAFSQISEQEKKYWLAQLDSGAIISATEVLGNYRVKEALPKFEANFWKVGALDQCWFLDAMARIDSSIALKYTLAFIDSADNYKDFSPISLKLKATFILFSIGNYSTTNYVFEWIDKYKRVNPLDESCLALLPRIYKYVPEYSERAKRELIQAADTCSDESICYLSLVNCEEIFGKEQYPLYIRIFTTNKYASVRSLAFHILTRLNYPELHELTKRQLYIEDAYPYRISIIDSLLCKYGSPSDFQYVKNYLVGEPDEMVRKWTNMKFEVYKPIKPSSKSSIIDNIDTLTSYVNQVTQLNWVDNSSAKELMNLLTLAKSKIIINDTVSCSESIKQFQNKVDFDYKHFLNMTTPVVNKDAWKFLYYYSGYILNRLPAVLQIFNLNIIINGNGTVEKSPSQTEYDSSSTVTLTAKPSPGYIFKEWTGDITGTNPTASVVMNSNKNITAVFIPSPSGAKVKLLNSSGALLTGGTLQYYEGAWKDAVNNNDGTFTVNTTKPAISLRMTYEYGSQTKQNVPVGNGDIVFQTVNAQVQLMNSIGDLISEQGTVQYYAGAWRTFGITSGGIAFKELLPGNYSFRMTYAFASKDMQQDISSNAVVTFRTVKAQVQLKNSKGAFMDQGTVQYYAGAWRSFGVTSNGTASLELLPNNYSFRMTYAFSSTDKQQDIGNNSTVVFQTVNAAVQLQNSKGELIDRGTVQYYAGAWREFGSTTNGTANKELLPNNYSFRMTYEYSSSDKQQNLNDNPTVVFKTINAQVQLKNSLGSLINDQSTVQYYAGAWRVFGNTSGGISSKELLAGKYSFRITYAFASKDLQQDITTNPVVTFQTVKALVQLKNSQGSLIDQGTVQYYSGAWRSLGVTSNGTASIELLPNNYSFRMTYEYVSVDKQQDIGTDNTIGFSTILCTVRVKDAQGSPVNNAQVSYYSGAWRLIGSTVSGEITKELLPSELSFRAKLGTKQMDVKQNIASNNTVEIILP